MIVAIELKRGHVALSMKVQGTNKVDELFDGRKVDELMSRPPSTGSIDFPEGEGSGSEELQHVSRDAPLRACTWVAASEFGQQGLAACWAASCWMVVSQQSVNLPDPRTASPIVDRCLPLCLGQRSG